MSKFNMPLRIRYEYKLKKDVSLEYAHGVWGGVNPHGEIELNFYTESDAIPPFAERIVTPEGHLGHEVTPEEEDVKLVTRSVNSRIVMNYATARAMYEWLDERLASLEAEMEGSTPQRFFDGGNIEQ